MLNSCCWLFLTNHSEENTVCIGQVVFGSHKDKLFEDGLLPDRSNNDKPLSMGLWKNFNSILTSPVLGNLLVFTWLQALVCKATMELEKRTNIRASKKCHKACCSYREKGVDFLINVAPDGCKPLVNYQRSEKVDLDNFCKCSW